MLSHGKVDRSSFFMAGPKAAKLQQTSGPKSPRKIIIQVLEKYIRLVAFTYTSPKVDMTASKLVPRKEKIGSQGFDKYFQNNLSYLVIKLVITVSIRVFFFIEIFFIFFFLSIYWLRAEC